LRHGDFGPASEPRVQNSASMQALSYGQTRVSS